MCAGTCRETARNGLFAQTSQLNSAEGGCTAGECGATTHAVLGDIQSCSISQNVYLHTQAATIRHTVSDAAGNNTAQCIAVQAVQPSSLKVHLPWLDYAPEVGGEVAMRLAGPAACCLGRCCAVGGQGGGQHAGCAVLGWQCVMLLLFTVARPKTQPF